MKNKYNNKGFTLVELIVVIVIILILGAVLVPNVLKYVSHAQKARCASDCHSLQVAYASSYVESNEVNLSSNDSFKTIMNQALVSCGNGDANILETASGLNISGFCNSGVITAIRDKDGRVSLTCNVHGGSDNAGEESSDTTGATTQANDFIAAMQIWLKDRGNIFANSANNNKSDFYKEYYQEHPEAVQMSEEYKQKLNALSDFNPTLKKDPLYWWTYPVTDSTGKVLYTVTYANKVSDSSYWYGSTTQRGGIGGGYVVIVNGKSYYRSNNGNTVNPGNVNSLYQTEDALEDALKANGYRILE